MKVSLTKCCSWLYDMEDVWSQIVSMAKFKCRVERNTPVGIYMVISKQC